MLRIFGLKTISFFLIIAGIMIPLISVPFSSAFDGRDSLLWRFIRVIWTGEIVLREAVFAVVPDRDNELYKALNEYRMKNKQLESLPDDHIVDKFYNERYKGLMPRVEFNLKLKKKQVVTLRSKIALPNLHIFLAGFLMVVLGIVIRVFAGRKNAKEKNNAQTSGLLE